MTTPQPDPTTLPRDFVSPQLERVDALAGAARVLLTVRGDDEVSVDDLIVLAQWILVGEHTSPPPFGQPAGVTATDLGIVR